MARNWSIIVLWVLVAVACGAASSLAQVASDRQSAAQSSTSEKTDGISWRYRYHEGRWWYWLPSNSWAVHENGRWVAYNAGGYQRSSGRAGRASQVLQESDADARWPRGDNGSSPYASARPGGAGLAPRENYGYPPAGRWPRGNNGSNPYASPEPGGARTQPNYNLPPPGRWPRGDNGSDPYASPQPGGAR